MLYNTNNKAPMCVGKCYYKRKGNGDASVRKILSIQDGKVHFERIFGKEIAKLGKIGASRTATFRRWITGEVVENANFEILCGAKIQPTYAVLALDGTPIFRCFQKRANFYLRRGFAVKVDENTLQLTENGTGVQDMMVKLYGEAADRTAFFMAVKNDRCCVCGEEGNLTRHHVLPKRHKKKIPIEILRNMSNVLFICADCHQKYERYSEKEPNNGIEEPMKFVKAWRDHFITTMQPKFMPVGWDIFTFDTSK